MDVASFRAYLKKYTRRNEPPPIEKPQSSDQFVLDLNVTPPPDSGEPESHLNPESSSKIGQ